MIRRCLFAFALVPLLAPLACGQEYKSGVKWQEPPLVTPGETAADPPSDATILFAGTDLSAFENAGSWKVEHGVATVGKKSIRTKEAFGDCQIHVEFKTPTPPKGNGQGRGNSGIYIMGRYEVQVLDSYENETYYDGQAAALYKQSPPLVNASRPPGQWQTYDIIFERPHFDENGSLVKPAYATVLHNGVAVQVHQELRGNTSFNKRSRYDAHPDRLPISIQNHNNPVQFRNIWVRDLELDRGAEYPDA